MTMMVIYWFYSCAFTLPSCLLLQLFEKATNQNSPAKLVIFGTSLGFVEGALFILILGNEFDMKATMYTASIFSGFALTASIGFVSMRALMQRTAQQGSGDRSTKHYCPLLLFWQGSRQG